MSFTCSFAGGIGGGGASNLLLPDAADPNVAYVRTSGNDGDAVVGDPFRPFASWLAAYSAGARVFDMGVGTFAGGSVTTLNVKFLGKGKDQTFVGAINGTSGSVYGNGRDNITVGGVNITFPNGADNPGGDGFPGTDATNVNIIGIKTTSDVVVTAGTGGTGGNGDDGILAANGFGGGNGGASASVFVQDCIIGGYVAMVSGNGGTGGNGGNSPDDSDPTSAGGNGGNGGNGGSQGVITCFNSFVGGFYAGAASAGLGGAGGGGLAPGSAGNPGTGGSAGTISTQFVQASADVSDGETTTYHLSMVSGTPYT